MSDKMTAELDRIEASHAKAVDELNAAVQRQWAGEHALKLRIPADRGNDTDLIVSDGLAGIPRMARLIRALRRVVADWRQFDKLRIEANNPKSAEHGIQVRGLERAAYAELLEAESALAELQRKEWE